MPAICTESHAHSLQTLTHLTVTHTHKDPLTLLDTCEHACICAPPCAQRHTSLMHTGSPIHGSSRCFHADASTRTPIYTHISSHICEILSCTHTHTELHSYTDTLFPIFQREAGLSRGGSRGKVLGFLQEEVIIANSHWRNKMPKRMSASP